MNDYPYSLGICRDCSKCRKKITITLDGNADDFYFYCIATHHITDGTIRCKMFSERHGVKAS